MAFLSGILTLVAENVSYSIKSNDKNIYLEKNRGRLGDMEIGEIQKITCIISPNKRVQTKGFLPIYLTLREKIGQGSLIDFQLPIKLNQKPPSPNILTVTPDIEKMKKQIARFEFTSKKFTTKISNFVDINHVVVAKTKRPKSVGVVLGIENYKYLPPAPYAVHDAQLMKKYFERRLGVEEVVLYKEDEISGFIFDDIFNPDYGELQKAVLKGKTELFVYYSGHGIPNKTGDETYLFPVDGKIERLAQQGYSLTRFFRNLNSLGAKNVTVILDACFSGASRYSEQINQQNLIAAKGLMIKLEKPWLNYKNFTIINSSAENETSLGFDKSKTGLFTYYLAAALRGEADFDKNHLITLGELKRYVTRNVIDTSKKFLGIQTPEFIGDESRVLVEW
ncbi:MAG: caspase domain-containing protein [bacterium]